jgi:hypothetical protein
MKLIGLIPLAGILILMSATVADSLAKEKTTYDKACIEKGLKAEIVSSKTCGKMHDEIDCFNFDHDDCLVEMSGNPPTGWAYFAGLLMVLCGGIVFGLVWSIDRKMKHEESMKALS